MCESDVGDSDCVSVYHAGSAALQLTPVQSLTDFSDASEVRNVIQLKGYFKGSSNSWNHGLDSEIHHEITLSALGVLIGHLSRLMVSSLACLSKTKNNYPVNICLP